VAVDDEAVSARAELAEDDGEAAPHLEGARARADPLHQLLDALGQRAHPRPARRHRRHPAERLQALHEGVRVAVNIAVEARERHI
jgi:hypothetical protein